jgi:hypothetical protein
MRRPENLHGVRGSITIMTQTAMAQRIEFRSIRDLAAYANNPRTHIDEQVYQIAALKLLAEEAAPGLTDEDACPRAARGAGFAARRLVALRFTAATASRPLRRFGERRGCRAAPERCYWELMGSLSDARHCPQVVEKVGCGGRI